MKTMEEIKKMTGQELAEYMTEKCYYTGVTDGLYFEVEIDGYKVPCEIGTDPESDTEQMVEMGILTEEEVESYLENDAKYELEYQDSNYNIYNFFIEKYYFDHEREVDQYLISSSRDYVIETLEENLQELKDKDNEE